MFIFFRVLSAAYIAAIFLLADSPMVDDVAAFNPYSILHIPLYGILTFLLILSLRPKSKKYLGAQYPKDSTASMDPIDPSNPANRSTPSNPIYLFVAGIIALLVAVADEVHQAYLPTRNGSILDVFLDIIGIVLCVFLILKLGRKSGFVNFMMLAGAQTQKKVFD